jgi:hypothetical protein
MDLSKIKALLKEMKISEESSTEFITLLEGWVADQKKLLNEEFTKRIEQAKMVCIEETEAHKATLSRGVKVFLESKIQAIEKAASKKKAIEESESVNTLKHIKALLEGINVDEAKANQDLQAANKEKAALKKELAEARESLTREKAKTSKLSEISEKAMERQKMLESKLQTAEKEITESKNTVGKEVITGKTLAEAKTPVAKPKTESVVKQKPIVESESSDIDVIAAAVQ